MALTVCQAALRLDPKIDLKKQTIAYCRKLTEDTDGTKKPDEVAAPGARSSKMDKEESAGEGLFSLKPVGCFWKAFFLVDFGNPPVVAKKIRPNA